MIPGCAARPRALRSNPFGVISIRATPRVPSARSLGGVAHPGEDGYGIKCGRSKSLPRSFMSTSNICRSVNPWSISPASFCRVALGMPQPLGLQLASV